MSAKKLKTMIIFFISLILCSYGYANSASINIPITAPTVKSQTYIDKYLTFTFQKKSELDYTAFWKWNNLQFKKDLEQCILQKTAIDQQLCSLQIKTKYNLETDTTKLFNDLTTISKDGFPITTTSANILLPQSITTNKESGEFQLQLSPNYKKGETFKIGSDSTTIEINDANLNINIDPETIQCPDGHCQHPITINNNLDMNYCIDSTKIYGLFNENVNNKKIMYYYNIEEEINDWKQLTSETCIPPHTSQQLIYSYDTPMFTTGKWNFEFNHEGTTYEIDPYYQSNSWGFTTPSDYNYNSTKIITDGNAYLTNTATTTRIDKNFNDANTTGWSNTNGTWTMANGTYTQTNQATDNAYSWHTDYNLSNGEAQADINSYNSGAGENRAGVIMRKSTSLGGRFYYCVLDYYTNQIVLGERVSASQIDDNTANFNCNYNQIYTIKITATNGNISCYANGNLLVTAADATYTNGYGGLYTRNTATVFDNFTYKEYTGGYWTDQPTITPNTPLIDNNLIALGQFIETATKPIDTNIKYQITNDNGTTYYWYNSGWATATNTYTQSNTATDINANLPTFPIGLKQIKFRAYLNTNGTNTPKLDDTQITYLSDSTPTTPKLIPEVDTNKTNILLEWQASTDPENSAIQYNIQVGTSYGGNNIADANTSDLNYSLIGLNYNYYYWRARACDDANGYYPTKTHCSDWNHDDFNVFNLPPTTPTLIPEPDTQTNTIIILDWNDSTDPESDPIHYIFNLGTCPTCNDIVDANTTDSNYHVMGLDTNTYYWRVKACDNWQCSEFSAEDTFNVIGDGNIATPEYIHINDGDYSTTSNIVQLNTYSLTAVQMTFSCNGTNWLAWQDYNTCYFNWDLFSENYGCTNNGIGTYTVYAAFSDINFNVTYTSDTIIYQPFSTIQDLNAQEAYIAPEETQQTSTLNIGLAGLTGEGGLLGAIGIIAIIAIGAIIVVTVRKG